MASAAQITANQANARHSTGPRPPEGKAKSARNRTAHGLSSREFVILPHQEAEFEEFMTGLHHSIKPHGALEHDLFTQLAHAAWNLRRCRIAERELQDSLDPGTDPLLAAQLTDRLRLIDLYMRRSERTYQRLLKELKALQTNRQYQTDLDLAAHGRAPYAEPAPLSQCLALDSFRGRICAEANARDLRRRVAELMPTFPPPGLDVSSVLAAVPAKPAKPGAPAEQSNPIPAARRAAAR